MGAKYLRKIISSTLNGLAILVLVFSVRGVAAADEENLPTGYHAGLEGEANDVNSCSAFGWASDPDDRDKDLDVRILADEKIVAITSANQIWEGAEICPDRSCGFNVSLWGLISPYKEHTIKAQAYDKESGAWYDLEATEKSLTCNVPSSPTPWFTVFPEQGVVEGWDWPLGAKLVLTINDEVYSTTEASIITPWDPESNATWVWIDFSEADTVQPDDVVTVSLLGSGMMKQIHAVQNLSVTKVDQMDETVKGVADPGAEVHVWPYEGPEQLAIAKTKGNAAGKWNAYFSEDFDLAPGECGRSEIYDGAGNRTAVDWCIPNPTFVAYVPGAVEGYDWPTGDEISLSINGDTYPVTAYSEQRPDSPEGETRVLFEIWREDWSLTAGDHVVMTDLDNGIEKDVTVTNLAVTDYNVAEGTVSGIYDPEFDLWVWLYDIDGQVPEADPYNGIWTATFTELPLGAWGGATQWDEEGDGTSIDFQVPGGQAGNFTVQWSQVNPEEVVFLSWKGSYNLTNPWANPYCSGDLEFFGNSWASENEGPEDPSQPFFFSSLVGWGTTGTWTGYDNVIDIGSQSSGCYGSAEIPVHTIYEFYDESKPDLIRVERTFEFGETPYEHHVRAFIPRLFPAVGFTQVIHPNANGSDLVVEGTCGFGCMAANWDGSWFAIHNPGTGLGMIVQRESSFYSVALWLDDDAGSLTNATSFLLLQPDGGFTGEVMETEYLCFYDSSWTPSLDNLPEGCQP